MYIYVYIIVSNGGAILGNGLVCLEIRPGDLDDGDDDEDGVEDAEDEDVERA